MDGHCSQGSDPKELPRRQNASTHVGAKGGANAGPVLGLLEALDVLDRGLGLLKLLVELVGRPLLDDSYLLDLSMVSETPPIE